MRRTSVNHWPSFTRMFTAMVIALSQIILVDFNYVLIGRRELYPALVSVGVILVSWAAVAFVYDKLSEAS